MKPAAHQLHASRFSWLEEVWLTEQMSPTLCLKLPTLTDTSEPLFLQLHSENLQSWACKSDFILRKILTSPFFELYSFNKDNYKTLIPRNNDKYCRRYFFTTWKD